MGQNKLQNEQKVVSLMNTKLKTEAIVNQKADQTLGRGIQSMQVMVQDLVKAIAQQSADNQRMLSTMVEAIKAPRKRKAIRGKDGKIESVVEEVA